MSTKTVDAAQISQKLHYLVGILKASPTHGALARRWAAELNKLLGSDDQSIAFRGDERSVPHLDAVVRAIRQQMPWRRGGTDPTPADVAELARLADLLACALLEPRWPSELKGGTRKLVTQLLDGKSRSFTALLNTIWNGKSVKDGAIERAITRANASLIELGYTISIHSRSANRFAKLKKLTEE